MIGGLATKLFVALVSVLSLASLAYVYVFPPPSMRVTRDGVPYFTPPVLHPETGKPLDLGELVRHYKGE